MKRINILLPKPLYEAWRKIFPYRGELTAFVRRCMEFSIREGRPPISSKEEIREIREGVRKEVGDE